MTSAISEQFSNSHYFWQAAYLQDNPPLPRDVSYRLAKKYFGKLKYTAKQPLTNDDINLYLFHLSDEAISRFSQNIKHFAPLSGNPHDVIRKDILTLKFNQDLN